LLHVLSRQLKEILVAQKILLADDSMTAQNMGKKILTDAGYEVIAVSNGAAAVKKIAEHKPDLAVLDVYMPGYTGLEVCERVKNALETSKMPVLLSVGKMEPFKPEEGNRVKADGLLVKPFEATDLLAAVQKLLNKMKAPTGTVMITPGDPHAAGGYSPTVLVQAPDFKDASYESWKSQAAEQAPDAAATNPVSFPTAMQESPAMGMDHFDDPAPPATAMMSAPTTELAPKEILRAQPAPKTTFPAIPESADETIRSKPRPPEPDFSRGWFGAAAVSPGDAETAMLDSDSPEALETLAPVSSIPSADDRAPVVDAAVTRLDPGQASPEETAHFEAVQTYGASSSSPAEGPTAAPPKAMAAAAIPDFGPGNSDLTQGFPEHHIAADAGADLPPAVDPNLEVTSPRLAHELEAVAAPGLEPTTPQAAESDVSVPTDPGLMTDASEMAAAFPTRFGVPGAEPLTVGMAADLPELYAEAEKAVSQSGEPASEGPPVWEAEDASEADSFASAQTETAGPHRQASDKDEPQVYEVEETPSATASAGPPPAWKAFETSLNIHEKSLSLHQEMQQQFAKASPSSGAETAADLAKAMAAAVGAGMAPKIAQAASGSGAENPSLDAAQHEGLIADIVHRVTERMKPHLAAEVARELASELAKKKK
jgi:CheY-like chemotaxis protein